MDRDLTESVRDDGVIVPQFAFPEDAVRSLAHAVGYSQWLARPRGDVIARPLERGAEAKSIIRRALAAGREWLEPAEVEALLSCYGLPLIPTRVVKRVDGVLAAAAEFGGPIVLKAIAPGLVRKTDAGGVLVGLDGEDAIRAGAKAIRKAVVRAGHRVSGFVVQPLAEPGVELLLGVVHDPSFGPLIACGAGGVNGELLGDVAVRITPLTDLDAGEMLRSLRTYPLLLGYRGQPGCDIPAVEAVLLGLSAMVEAHPEIAEFDANPVIAGPGGALIVDARMRVREPAPERPVGSLRT